MLGVPQDSDDANRNNTIQNHSTELDFSLYNDNYTPTISIQPQIAGGTRRPIPVLSNWGTNNTFQFTPEHGLDFLSRIEQVHVQQTVELNELFATEESENRYTIKIPQGETVYYASETSSSCQRMCFGPSRSFIMKLFDTTQQEAIEFRRRLACGICSFWCYLQAMEVLIPSGDLIGTVEQKININKPVFIIYKEHRQLIYRIEGPSTCACLSFSIDAQFKIYSADGATQVGSITRQWDQLQRAYNLCVQFPSRLRETKPKALILGAAFLLEYMYFTKTAGCRCAC